ncbi:hypothetical protein GCM10029992_51120 [Glycomyces albus]
MNTFETTDDAVIWRGDGETLMVQAWGRDSLRVRGSLAGPIAETDFALLEPEATPVEITVDGDTATLVNGAITAVLHTWGGFNWQAGYHTFHCSLEFQDSEGRTLLKELGGGAHRRTAREFRPWPGLAPAEGRVRPGAGEKLYGMGQYQQAIMDIKGSTFELAQRNSQASVPFVMSSAGYGFLWHNPAIGTATFAANRTEWTAEATGQLDYWITAGATPAAISAAYAEATGYAPEMPEYGLGYWQCKLRYWNQEQLLEVAREHQRRGLPLDVIVADFFHWPHMGDFRFESEFWPDPAAMVAELGEMGVELMVSVWPQVSLESENFAALKQDNLLVHTERGTPSRWGSWGRACSSTRPIRAPARKSGRSSNATTTTWGSRCSGSTRPSPSSASTTGTTTASTPVPPPKWGTSTRRHSRGCSTRASARPDRTRW